MHARKITYLTRTNIVEFFTNIYKKKDSIVK